MLNVERGDDVDAGSQQFLDILIPLGVPAAGSVRVRQFVDQSDGRTTGQHGVDVQFLQHDAAIFDATARHLFQIGDQCHGFGAAVRLDDANHRVDVLPLQPMGFLKHLVGLADAGREAEIDFQPAALPLANKRQKMFGPLMGIVWHTII